jgi:nitroimidazol reductase NimA-like FMN-containing flavoprotein (pyridoxamine 5'-phosphate oxidase superfamily)
MQYSMRELTDAEKEAFLTDNYWGILSFVGDDPYAIPIGYMYRKGDMIMGLSPSGRKMGYINRNRKVCFTICQPTALCRATRQSPDPMEAYPFNTVIIEGELEDVTDRTYYGLEPQTKDFKGGLFKIKQKRVGTQQLTMSP